MDASCFGELMKQALHVAARSSICFPSQASGAQRLLRQAIADQPGEVAHRWRPTEVHPRNPELRGEAMPLCHERNAGVYVISG